MDPEERKYYENFDSLDRYVPKCFNTKFFRYELADFDFEKAEQLRNVTYDKLIELKWMRRVRNQMKIDSLPKPSLPKT